MINREKLDFSDCDFQSGEEILIDKPFGWSSFKVVYEVRKAAGVKKVGHAGTLDPLATGLLILCTGKKTKEISKFQEQIKVYTGTITLGKRTPSMDLETEVTEELPFNHITEEDIFKIRDNFLGKILQIPPMYSAVKHQGKSLYQLARKGKVIERETREAEIFGFEIFDIKLPLFSFRITCSKGTYIRAIADDLGRLLNCGGVLSSLRRTNIGNYNVNNAITVDLFKERALNSGIKN